jgi:Tol biopolymer transport system component
MMANLSKIQIAVLTLIVLSACACKDKTSDPIGERPVVNFEIDRQAVWHEGYDLIAYAHGCPGITDPDSAGIYIIKPDGTDKRYFYHGSFFISGLDWSPDGRWIIVDDYRNLVKISYPDGNADTLISGDRNFFPVWSPSGQNIAYAKHVGDDSGIYICDEIGNGSRLIIRYGFAADWPYQVRIPYCL